MKPKILLIQIISVILLILLHSNTLNAQDSKLVVRIAKLQIDSTLLDEYKSALKEEIEASVSKEPGVLTLYAVYEKEKPANVTIFEIYADETAYQSHLLTPHFKKYKTGTAKMVKSLELVPVSPIALQSKLKQ